jgi:ABC-type glycerol-3-phosphate transport system permease component
MLIPRPAAAKVSRKRIRPGEIFMHIGLLLGLVVFIFPFYWMITSSLKPMEDIFTQPVQLWPVRPTINGYLELFGIIPSVEIQGRGNVSLSKTLLNSMIVSVTYTLGSVFFATLAGYTFAKIRFKGRDGLFVFMLATMMIPGSVGLIPNYIIMAKLKWINTFWPLIIPALATPFAVFWMRQYITTIPDEMIEAAQIDGAGPFGIFWRVVAPVVTPGIAALAIFNFMGSWNAFQGPLIYLNKANMYTAPLFMALLNSGVTGRPTPLHLVFGTACISTLPILLIFLFAQRYFIAGLTAGSIK